MKKNVLFSCVFALWGATSMAQSAKITQYIDPANMDVSVKPGDDFYRYANGAWIKKNPVPSSKTRWSTFAVLAEEASTSLRMLLEDAAKNLNKSRLTQMVGEFYASAMDTVNINKKGFIPIKADLDRLAKLNSHADVLDAVANMRVQGIASPLFGFSVSQDSKKVTEYIPQIGQGGTTLPDRDYYLKNDARSTKIRAAYLEYVRDMFKLTGVDDATATQNAAAIMALETQLAGAQMSRVEMRDPQKLYNKFFVPDLSKTTPSMNWTDLMAKMKVTTADSVIVSNPKFLRFVDSLLPATPVSTWKSYLQWYVIKNSATYLSDDFVKRNFQFNQVLSGQKEMSPRWERMSGLTDNTLGELLGQLYVEKYFKPEAKQRMLALVTNLQQAFEERIKQLDWMTPDTKTRALKKLGAFSKKIGYTDKWKTYDGIVIKRDDLVGNLRSASQWSYEDRVKRLGKPVDKSEWGMTPPTINASYSPVRNDITFPAGILQFPFFDFNADDAVNYGGIGAVIGHEMTHGFDDQGRQFDADGNLKDWWSEEDAKKFKERADKVVEQYNGFTVLDTLHLNGKLTLGENIADLGGLSMAYAAFKKTPQGKSNKKIDGFTPDQRFFLGWAQVWRGNSLPETSAQLVLVDPHSPGEYRTNGTVIHMKAFYDAFNVKEGDKMYVPVEKRIVIW